MLKAHVSTVHEERSVSAEALGRQVDQVRLRNCCVVQMERPLQVAHKQRDSQESKHQELLDFRIFHFMDPPIKQVSLRAVGLTWSDTLSSRYRSG